MQWRLTRRNTDTRCEVGLDDPSIVGLAAIGTDPPIDRMLADWDWLD